MSLILPTFFFGQPLGNQVFEPHTDGAFLNALYRDEKMIMRHISPPATLILQCVTQALIGGNSLLIDGKCVYDSIKDKSPEMLEILFESIFHFVRNGSELFPIDSPIFKYMSNGNICVRFRTEYIISTLCNRNRSFVKNCIERMFEDFLMSPDCGRSILLSPGDMLIIDNFRMLHGRAPFSIVDGHHRHLRRLWITDEEHLQRLNGDKLASALVV
jgi:gamma-butyrobetaine dioxygenase